MYCRSGTLQGAPLLQTSGDLDEGCVGCTHVLEHEQRAVVGLAAFPCVVKP